MSPIGPIKHQPFDFLKNNFAARDHNRRSANSHFIYRSEFAYDLNIDPAGTMYEVSLLDYELKSSVARLDIRRAVMDQVGAQRTGGAACCRIFGNVICRSKESRMGARRANLDRFTRKRVTASSTHAFVKLRQQCGVYSTAAQV